MGWLIAGHAILGVTIGAMIGLSKSHVVSAALPLLFAFAGGSIIGLSAGRTEAELTLLGQQLTFFSAGVLAGMIAGIWLRKAGRELPFAPPRTGTPNSH